MQNRNWIARVVLGVVVAGLLWGLLQMSRLSTASDYPDLSTFSTNPRGLQLLYEALARSGKFTVERNYLPPDQFRPSNATVVVLNVHPFSLIAKDASFVKHVESLAAGNDLLIIGLTKALQPDPPNESGKGDGSKERVWNQKAWDIVVRRSPAPEGKAPHYHIVIGSSWTAISGANAWRRGFGGGSVILLRDAQLLSNLQLAKRDESRALVASLFTGPKKVYFDEAQLGVVETGSVAGLIRKYRLSGLVAGLLVIASLYVWKSAVRFPPVRSADRAEVLLGGGLHSMMSELLRRHIGNANIIEACIAEWNRVMPRWSLDGARWHNSPPVEAYAGIAAELPKRI
jgi:hypothetical protein